MKIEPFKMEVTPEQSRQVQEIIFRNGGSWSESGPVIKHTYHPYLCYNSDKDVQFVRRENRSDFDNNRPEPLITFADFMARYGGAQTPQFDIMRKIVTIAEDAHKNGEVELCGVLLDALSDYLIRVKYDEVLENK